MAGGTVKVPVFGTVKKKTAMIVGVGAPALVLIVYWYRARKAAQAAPAAAAATGALVTDPAGNSCAALNPATGYCPGTQADLNAQSLGAVNAGGAGEGLSGYYYGSGGTPGTNPGPGNFADNAEWAQYVIAYEENNGLNPNVANVTVSLGLYVAGSPVTQSQQTDIETAIGIAGQPPIPGANGMPPGINLQATNTGTGTTTAGPPVVVRMPDGRLGWEDVTFPNQGAADAWTAWNVAQHGGQGTRSAWNAELQLLGATGWLPVVPYNPAAPLGTPGNTGNRLDTE
jgi:hypothetical protein